MQVPKRKSEQEAQRAVDPHITKEKFNALTAELARLKKRRPQLADEVKTYAANGDFSENAEYQIAKGKLRGLNRRILEVGDLLRRAQIISRSDNADTVQLGSTVVVEAGNKKKTFRILGSEEANPDKGIISHNSPIGAALLGKRPGERASIRLAGKEVFYTLIKVT